MCRAIIRPRCFLALLAVTIAGAPAAAAGGGRGAAVTRPARAARAPHDSYRMNAARRTWTRARGQLTDVKADALVAEGKLSDREAFLLVRSGVEARRVALAIGQEPREVGVAFGVRTEKLQRLGLSRREARILARSGARPQRVREVMDSIVYRFLVGTDPAWAVPDDRLDDRDALDDRDDERLRASLEYLGVHRSAPDLLDAARRAYRAIARETHPDKVNSRTDLTAAEKASALRRFQQAAEHYETIVDLLQPARR